jgi:hypothetical protein
MKVPTLFMNIFVLMAGAAVYAQPPRATSESRPSIAENNKAGANGSSVPAVTIDVRVMLVETRQYVPVTLPPRNVSLSELF